MKKIAILASVLLIALGLMTVSCKNNSDSPTSIVGTWECDSGG